jgi:hypothetical protein|tara:strand:+ start:101 stop:625 length:525 start_codon:yes stop_codon:yes gene_type:complete
MKAKILLMITAILFLTGCESNDTPNSLLLSSADLIGNWNLTSQTIEDGALTVISDGQTITATYAGYAKDIDMIFSFTENPNEVTLDGRYTLVNTISILGQDQIEEEVILSDSETSNWSLDNNVLTITEDGIEAKFSIDEFSATSIKLKSEIDETETFNDESISTKATLYIVLEK